MNEYKATGIEGEYIIYRDKPLVRDNNVICYGDMSDPYVLFIMILSKKNVDLGGGKSAEVPDRILLQILSTDESKPSHERVAKQFEKSGLFDAIDIGLVWLDKLNSAA